ncbi:MAG TPA: pyridoxamine 5'-phosphate oxidase family protein [Acidimicrobiales bacterium]|nr:pyridoxamine 5'-phosphate oxidase family protein [Acidimicrobiales bacterium]
MEDAAGPITDHQGLEVIDLDECWRLIAESPVGRIAFIEAGEPTVFPVNHTVVGRRVVFRTARGAALQQALHDRPIAFEVDAFDTGSLTGWSVLVRGMATTAPDLEEEPVHLVPWADSIERDDWVAVVAEEVTGRRIITHRGTQDTTAG